MTTPTTLGAEVYVSLDGSAAFDGPDDRLLRAVHHQRGIELDEGRDGNQQLSPPMIGAGGFDLRNEDGRFSPEQAGSPYYQRFEEGKPVLYRAHHGEERLYRADVLYRGDVYYRGRGLYPLGRHVVEDIRVDSVPGNRRVPVETIGAEKVLTLQAVTIPLMTNPLVSDCFTAYLDAVGWPTNLRRIATSDTRLLYYWADEREPWSGMLELLASEGPGTFGVDREGVFFFESRNHRSSATRSATSQATIRDRESADDLYFTDFQYDRGARQIFNRATYTTRRRVAASVATKVWELGSSLVLGANQAQTLFVRPTDPFIDAVSPVAATDYTVSAGSATVALTYTSGFLAIITVTAGAGGATVDGVTSSGIQLRAKPLTIVSETTIPNGVDASASIARYSPIAGANIPRTLQVQGWPEIDTANAKAVCDAWVSRQMWPRPQVTFTLKNADGAHLERILRSRVSDRLTLVQAHTGLSADVWINRMQLRIADAGGRTVQLVVGAEKCDTLTGFVWDDPASLWDAPGTTWGI